MWTLAILLAGIWQVTGWLHWLAIIPAAGAMFVAPLFIQGGAAALPDLMTTRRNRMARRHGQPRPAIPQWLRRATYAADRYRCVYCRMRPGRQRPGGSVVKLQWDHIVPWSFGGLTSLWNGATLCDRCNRVKSNYWKSDSGRVYYIGWAGASNQHEAGRILRAELRARANPLRWLRAGRTWWFLVRSR